MNDSLKSNTINKECYKNILVACPGFQRDSFIDKDRFLVLNINDYKKLKSYKITQLVGGVWSLLDKQFRIFMEFLFLITKAKERYFIDNAGKIERFSFWRFLFIDVSLFILELLLGLVIIPVTWCVLFVFNLVPKKNKANRNNKSKEIIYLRTDNFRGKQEGGSFTHFRGVIKGFSKLGYKVHFIGSGKIQISGLNFLKTIIPYPLGFNLPEIPDIYYNWRFIFKSLKIVKQKTPLFIYQRLSVFNICGAMLSQITGVPLILEYNSSGCWTRQKWGGLLILKRLCYFMENFSLRKATLITVVSKPLKEELLKRGISEKKILVNYNGVDAESFNPNIDGSRVRERYKLGNKIVIGAVSTFGVWHGMPILAKAVNKIVNQMHDAKYQIHFLLIGNGVERPQCERIIRETKMEKYVTFTGIVSFRKIPQYLAACDILVSPHIPNSDGTPFFGSPTKLFEYMAMGKGIVASDLGQIGEILEHKKTAWLVKPGDVNALVDGIIRLIKDKKLREELGRNAREVVVKNYTWEQNVNKIIHSFNNVRGFTQKNI